MNQQWNYQLVIDGAIIKVPHDGRLLQPTKEFGHYNHLSAAFADLLQLNMYGFDSEFGSVRAANKWNRLYRSASITLTETGKPVVSILNLPIADHHRNPFMHPGLYLSFDVGISHFEKMAGFSLASLEPMDQSTAVLASYGFAAGQTLTPNAGLGALQATLAAKLEYEHLAPFKVSLKGPSANTTYLLSTFHHGELRQAMEQLLTLDLQRLLPNGKPVPAPVHPIEIATLEYGQNFYPVASMVSVDRAKSSAVLPGAYLRLTEGYHNNLETLTGIDLNALGKTQVGNLHYIKIASLSQDGSTLQPFAALQAVKDSFLPGKEPSYTVTFEYGLPAGAARKAKIETEQLPLSSKTEAISHLLSISKETLDNPTPDGRALQHVSVKDNRGGEVIGELFKQRQTSPNLVAGYYLRVNPVHLLDVLQVLQYQLFPEQIDKQLHFLLSPTAAKPTLKKKQGAGAGRKRPPADTSNRKGR